MYKSIAVLGLLATLPGCPARYGEWSGGCPEWQPDRAVCLVDKCEADVDAGIAREDSRACQEVDASDTDREEPPDTSDTGQ